VVGLAAGASVSIDALFRSESAGLNRLAFLLVADRGVAAEVVQEAFVEAVARWEVIAGYDRPDLWLRRVVVNRAVSRRRRRRSERLALARVASRRPAGAVGVDDEIDLGAWRLVAGLPVQQRQALALVYGGDLSVADAALVMGCSEGTVKTHLHRGRAAVQRRLEVSG